MKAFPLLALLVWPAQEKPPEPPAKAKLGLALGKGDVLASAVKMKQTFKQEMGKGRAANSIYDMDLVFEIAVDDGAVGRISTVSAAYKKCRARGTYVDPQRGYTTNLNWEEGIPADKIEGDPVGALKNAVLRKLTAIVDGRGKLQNENSLAPPVAINLFPAALLGLPSVLPPDEVEVGSTWETKADLNGVPCKFAHKFTRLDKNIAYVTTKITHADPALAKKNPVDGTAELQFDVASGTAVKCKAKVSVSIPGNFKVEQDFETTVKRVQPK